jgi:hypothetical protein
MDESMLKGRIRFFLLLIILILFSPLILILWLFVDEVSVKEVKRGLGRMWHG